MILGNPVTDAEKAWAISEVKTKASMAGTYISLLAANEGMLAAAGSKQKINYTDPRKPDFLAFKVGVRGERGKSKIGSLRFFTNMIHASIEARHGAEMKDTRGKESAGLVYTYARGKLSPFAQFAEDQRTQGDFQSRPMPWSKDKVPSYLAKEGMDKYSYPEYLTETFLRSRLRMPLRKSGKTKA